MPLIFWQKQINQQIKLVYVYFIHSSYLFVYIYTKIQNTVELFYPENSLGNNYICFLAPRYISCLEPFDQSTSVG